MTHYADTIRLLLRIDAYDPDSQLSVEMGAWHIGNHIPTNFLRVDKDIHNPDISSLDEAIAFIMDHIPDTHILYNKESSSIQWKITLMHMDIRYLDRYTYRDPNLNIVVQPRSYTPTLNHLPSIVSYQLTHNPYTVNTSISHISILVRNARLHLTHITSPRALSFESIHPGRRPGRIILDHSDGFFYANNSKGRNPRLHHVIVPTDIPTIHPGIAIGIYAPGCKKLEPTLVLLHEHYPVVDNIIEDAASLKRAIIQIRDTLPMASAHATLEWMRQWNTPQADASIAAMLSCITALRTDMESWATGYTTAVT